MPRHDYDIGIIGGGAAGLTVASGAAQLGARTLLIEREPALGGDCLHYGCVPSKTLIRTAHVYHMLGRAESYGLPRMEPSGPVEFGRVAGRIASVIARIQEHDSVERFTKLGARVEFGSAAFRDEHSVEVSGEGSGRRLSAARWVIATGSGPMIPAIPGIGETPYLTNREIFSLDRLPGSMIVLGAGPIAIEMAQAFSRLGTRVSVVQRGARILSREDADLAGTLMGVLEAEGIEFHLEASVREMRPLGGGMKEVVITSGERELRLEAEAVLVALGRSCNVSGMGLDRIGIDASRGFIDTDRRMRTAQRHIYAAGDVTGAYQFTHAAGYEGGVVIANAVFHIPRRADYRWFPRCTYTWPELATIGMNEGEARRAGLEHTVYTEEFSGNDRALAEGDTVGRVKLILGRGDRPLGVTMLGPHAGELLGPWVVGMNAGVRLTALASMVHAYPTLGEINKRVVGGYLSPRIFSARVRKALRFLFGLRGG